MKNLKVGTPVQVMDRGLMMLQQFAPPGGKPNNEGVISKEQDEYGYYEIEFPLEGDDHSQVSIYHHAVVQPTPPK